MFLNEDSFIDFLSAKEVTWAGIDFSKAKFCRNGFDFPTEIIQYFFNEWNLLIISDQKKYDIRLSFRKPILHYDLSYITKRNKTVKASSAVVDYISVENMYSEEEIIQYFAKLNLPQQTRFAISVLVEALDKNSKTAALWIVINDTLNKQVVLCEKFLKEPSGFNTKSYWARTFYNLFFDIQKSSFVRWENLVKNKQIQNTKHHQDVMS
ncbi:MAG: hypothetical protein IJU33_08105 [Bacteroidales bacterium]|nr:hypothetical protein [Bacteroidales bacterium]